MKFKVRVKNMPSLREIFEQAIEDHEVKTGKVITKAQLSRHIGCSNSLLTKYLNGEEEFSFPVLLNSIRFLCGDEKKYVSRIILDPNAYMSRLDNYRGLMLYLLAVRDINNLERVVSIQAKSSNRKNAELAKVINFFVLYYKGNTSEAEKGLKRIFPRNIEAKGLKLILHCFILHRKKQYEIMRPYIPLLEDVIGSLTDEYYRLFISQETNLIRSGLYLFADNDYEKAREEINKILMSKICGECKVETYYILSASYMFSDFDKSIKYMEKYRNELLRYGRFIEAEVAKEQDEVFIRVLCGRIRPEQINDVSEKAHYEARWGSKEKAIIILNSIPRTMFRDYYCALANDDGEKMFEVLVKMIASGDKFWAHVVYRSIIKFDEFRVPSRILMENS
jgi:hypothetical protein